MDRFPQYWTGELWTETNGEKADKPPRFPPNCRIRAVWLSFRSGVRQIPQNGKFLLMESDLRLWVEVFL